ncbi:MAG: D-alanyl-D-alanine carboxypeptidase, partial [Rickettsiales bacterium]|nr:D-alanyl-D-alanine carboxypeptidase [Rickettsiales bacterium]
GIFKREDVLIISKKAADQPRTKIGLIAGDTITIDTAIKGLIIKSANDAATVLAENIAETEADFAKLMTKTANELGMKNTTFANASGLNNNVQKTTAGDMAMLMMALQQHFPEYYKYFAVKSFKYDGTAYYNYSKIISGYEGCDGVKTGYIDESGFNLLASAKKGNNRVIAVLFGAKNQSSRDEEMKQLLDYGFLKIETNITKNTDIAVLKNN